MSTYFRDLPAREDRLNFQAPAERFLCDLRHGRMAPPLSVGVFGHWGQGKSSFLEMVKQGLEQEDLKEAYITLEFQPWRYQKEKNLMAPLLLELAERFPDMKIRESMYRIAGSLVYLAGDVLLKLQSFGLLSMKQVTKSMSYLERKDVYRVQQAREELSTFLHCREEIKKVFKTLTLDGSRTVILLVDDLDRCHPPELGVELLEQMHLFFAQPDMPVIFVAAVDHHALIEILTKRFGRDKAELYLEKFFQLPIHLPMTMPRNLVDGVARERLGGHPFLKTMVGKPEFMNVLERAASNLFDTPRRLKRFLNQLMYFCCVYCPEEGKDGRSREACSRDETGEREVLGLARWLVYREMVPALADDPVLLSGVEQEIRAGVGLDRLETFFAEKYQCPRVRGLAVFLLTTRKHALEDVDELQGLAYLVP